MLSRNPIRFAAALLLLATTILPHAFAQTTAAQTPAAPTPSPSAAAVAPAASAPPSAAPAASPTPVAVPVVVPVPAVAATPTPVPTPVASPIPLSDLVSQAESASLAVRGIDADLTGDSVASSIGTELPTFARETGARIGENSHILSGSPSLDSLRSMLRSWKQQRAQIDTWATQLTERSRLVDREIAQLAKLNATWQQTLIAAQAPGAGTPPEILHRVRGVLDAIATTQKTAATQRSRLLQLQNQAADEQAHVSDAFDALKQANDDAIGRLFVSDSPPLWSPSLYLAPEQRNLFAQGGASAVSQITSLAAYAQRRQAHFLLHALILIVLIAGLRHLRTRVRPMVAADPTIARAALVFETPFATGLVLSFLVCAALYSEAPRLLWAVLGALALLPTVWILRRLVEPALFPVLNALVAFYFWDQLRSVGAALPLLARLMLTVELLGGVLFLALQVKSARLYRVSADQRDHLWDAVRVGSRVVLGGLAIALVCAILGFVSLANLLGDGLLRSAYFAIILYALARIVGGLIQLALISWPLNRLGFVQRHRETIWRRAHEILEWLGLFLWGMRTLDMLALLGPVETVLRAILTTPLVLGSFSLTLGHTLAFGITIYLSFFLSRALRFLLDEDIYPRVDLPRGLPYAISTLLHYVVLLVGFFIAVAAMGFDMTKFTILAGAFGVGLGFGMQNIVNNFVSGLILLFERPVKVGDVISIDDGQGTVESIGIRASIIRTSTGSELIVPNGNLISNKVTNWTYSNNQRAITIPVTVASGTDPKRVMDLLEEIARSHELVAKEPPPKALFMKFGAASMDFELHAWTDKFDAWEQVRSDLAVAINARFAEEKIGVS